MVRRKRAARFVAMGGLVTGALAVQAGACGSDAADVASDDDGSADAAIAERTAPDSAWQDESDAASTPEASLEGWAPLTEYPGCGFQYPTDRAYLPEAVTWEPCSAAGGDAGLPGPEGMVCRRMATPWKGADAYGGVDATSAHVEPDGRVLMIVGRRTSLGRFWIVANADGPLQTALYLPEDSTCVHNYFDKVRFGHYVFRVFDDATSKEDRSGGALGGTVDELKPRVLFPRGHKPSSFFSHGYSPGRHYFVEYAPPDRVLTFDTVAQVDVLKGGPEDDDLVYSNYVFQEDSIFWVGLSTRRSAVKVWTREGGIKTLLDHGQDLSQGLGGFATDGVDMVWMLGSGRTNTSDLSFPANELWTAKYSTESSNVASTKRRVSAETRLFYWDEKFVVGCGYAALRVIGDTGVWNFGFRLTRLSDGVSWIVANTSEKQFGQVRFTTPIAITCDEVFVSGSSVVDGNERGELARIRIDSLGPGLPPQ